MVSKAQFIGDFRKNNNFNGGSHVMNYTIKQN